jgi:hypothetical protein
MHMYVCGSVGVRGVARGQTTRNEDYVCCVDATTSFSPCSFLPS